MFSTRIPAPESLEDEKADYIETGAGARYFIEEVATGRVCASGLNRREVVEFMWLSDGGDYEVRPRMGRLHDAAGTDTGAEHQIEGIFGLEWDLYFKTPGREAWEKFRITGFGRSKHKATVRLLDQAFALIAWSHDRYFAIRDSIQGESLAVSREQWSRHDPKSAQRLAL